MKTKFKTIKNSILAIILLTCVLLFFGCKKNNTAASSTSLSASAPASSAAASSTGGSSSASASAAASSSAASSYTKLDDESFPQPEQSLPPVTSDPAFNDAFGKNPIDAAYTQSLNRAASTNEIVRVMSDFTSVWDAEIDAAYNRLLTLTDSSTRAALEKEQTEWRSTLQAALTSIRNDVNATQTGSTAQITVASKQMEYYKARAVKLQQQLFAYNTNLTYAYKG